MLNNRNIVTLCIFSGSQKREEIKEETSGKGQSQPLITWGWDM